MVKKRILSMKEARKKIWEEIERKVIYGVKVLVEVLLVAERAVTCPPVVKTIFCHS